MIPTNPSAHPSTCLHCGGPFTPKQPGQKFCNAQHRSAYHNAERKRLAGLGANLAPRRVELSPGETFLIHAKETSCP